MGKCSKLYTAKSGVTSSYWLPLWIHHLDTYKVMEYLLDKFVSDSFFYSCSLEKEEAEKIALFLALVHDIGKATVGFQYKISFSVPERVQKLNRFLDIPERMDMKTVQNTPHSYAGEAILKYMGCPESIAAVVGSHHGVPAETLIADLTCDQKDIIGYRNFYGDTEENRSTLESTWKHIIDYAVVKTGFENISELPDISEQVQMLLTGLVITADWIASNTNYFPLISIDDDGDEIDFEKRTSAALKDLNFTDNWNPDKISYSEKEFENTFGFLPRPIQKRVIEIAESAAEPGLFILEAPMGCGKTEAALSSAELIASKCDKNGLFFGMPTQATANGIFPRVINWAEKQSKGFYHSVQLKHGSSALNETFQNIQKGIPEENDSGVIVHSWFCDSKKACLSDFVVATVDQMLMMALKRRHVMLLHLGLSEKVVIIDEVHAYDAYMNQYLERALQWLGAYHTPVILLSATLPSKRRMSLVRAYLRKRRSDEKFEKNIDYPLLTWTDGGEINQESLPYSAAKKTVQITKCRDDDILDIVKNAVSAGGCVGIIMNTVHRAQLSAEQIRNDVTHNVLLYHAQYIMTDRAAKEEQILERIGHDSTSEDRRGLVVVGTQVLEQSLDIDFDLLITDICPVDLLLQRIGRLHRHTRNRPDDLGSPVCCVVTDEYENDKSGSKSIYGTWLLKETLKYIPDSVTLPDDISPLVQKVYDSFDDSEEYRAYLNSTDISVSKAGSFLLKKPKRRDILHGLLDRTVNDSQAEASVRDGTDSVEVLAMKLYSDGTIGFLDDTKLPGELTDEEYKNIAKQKLRLPSLFSRKWNIDKAIAELEKKGKPYTSEWQKNYWLKGQLFLFFDENNEAELSGYTLKYNHETGLTYKKE